MLGHFDSDLKARLPMAARRMHLLRVQMNRSSGAMSAELLLEHRQVGDMAVRNRNSPDDLHGSRSVERLKNQHQSSRLIHRGGGFRHRGDSAVNGILGLKASHFKLQTNPYIYPNGPKLRTPPAK